MKKSIILVLTIVLCAFIVASCEQEPPKLQGYYYCYGGTPYAYSFLGDRVITYKDVYDHVLNKGTYVRSGNKLDILWDDGRTSTKTVITRRNYQGAEIDGVWYTLQG